jgi:hypothetical protein
MQTQRQRDLGSFGQQVSDDSPRSGWRKAVAYLFGALAPLVYYLLLVDYFEGGLIFYLGLVLTSVLAGVFLNTRWALLVVPVSIVTGTVMFSLATGAWTWQGTGGEEVSFSIPEVTILLLVIVGIPAAFGAGVGVGLREYITARLLKSTKQLT